MGSKSSKEKKQADVEKKADPVKTEDAEQDRSFKKGKQGGAADDQKQTSDDDVKSQESVKLETDFMKNNAKFAELVATIKDGNKKHPLYDLISLEQEKWILDLSELALSSNLVDTTDEKSLTASIQALTDLQFGVFANHREDEEYSLIFYQALSNARSRLSMQLMSAKKASFALTIIVPLWGEHHRMQSREDHPNGEDFVRRKVRQLQWLFDGLDSEAMEWNLMFIDDGCPNDSGNALKKLMDEDKDYFTENIREKISVEFLAEGLETIEKFKNDDTLNSVNDSRKGGAVQYGFFKALAQPHSDQKPRLIMYTDADLSADLSQCGLLLRDITTENMNGARKAVIADRYSKGIFSDGNQGYDKGILGTFKTNEVALRLRSLFRGQMLPPLRYVDDSQCGFKVFVRDCIERVLPKLTSYQGMFDMELLMKSFDEYTVGDNNEDNKDDGVSPEQLIHSTGVVWLHSAEESNFDSTLYSSTEFTNAYGWKHFNQIQEIIGIHNSNYKESKLCDKEWVEFIKTLSWRHYFQIAQILFLGGTDMKTYRPEIKDLEALIKEEYPEKAPEWIEDPSKDSKL